MYVLRWKNPALVVNGVPDANKEMPINVPPASVVADRAPIKFTGKGAGNFGQIQQENLMRIMENFADTEDNPPEHPTVGMEWYDTTNSQLKICIQTNPTKWRVVAGLLVTNVGQEAPNGQLGDIWFERTGPLTGFLYVFTGTGRYPLSTNKLGGWNQIWPEVDIAGGREEYDAMLTTLEKLIGSTSVGGNGAISRSIQNLTTLTQLDAALREKYQASPDTFMLREGDDINLLKVDPISKDWDTLLAAVKYAIGRLDVPLSVKKGISDFPFVQDGRQADQTLLNLNAADPRYPVPLRRALRRMGYVTMTRLYSSTQDALEKGLADRYSIQGINGGTLHSTATKTTHVIFGGSQASRGTQSNLRLAFRFADADSQKRFLFSGGAIQVTMRHSNSQIGSSDQNLSAFLNGKGGFRITADRVRMFNNAYETSSMTVANLGLNDATPTGKVLATVTAEDGTVIKVSGFKVSDTRLDIDIGMTVPLALNGKTTFKYEIIEDVEKYTSNSQQLRVFAGVLPFAAGDGTGSSWYAVDTNDQPPQVNVPSGTLLYAECAGTTMNGVFANGDGGTYSNPLQTNSPQCGGSACAASLFGNGSINIPAKVTAITLTGTAGISAPSVATVDGQTKTFTTASNTTTTVTFGSNTAGKTLTFTIPLGAKLGMAYCDFVPAPPKPKGELLRTECRGFDKWGIYADGNYGEEAKIIQANSTECNYVGSDPAAQFDVTYATFGGGGTTNVPWNSSFIFTLSNIKGFTPGQTYTVTAAVSGASAKTETLGSFTASENGTASGLTKSYTNNGAWPSGSYSAIATIKNSAGTTVLTLGPRTFSLAINQTESPSLAFYLKGSQTPNQAANVGDSLVTKVDSVKFAPNSTVNYYLDITGADPRTTGPFTYTADAAGSVTFSFSSTLLDNPNITGDVTYRWRAIGTDSTGTSKTVTSNAITVTWTKAAPAPTLEFYLSNTKNTPQSAQVGDALTTRLEFRNFGPNVPVTAYLDISGADNRTTGPYAFTSDANGSVSHSFSSTLLLNPDIRGDVTYKWRVTGNDKAGISKNAVSNTITVNWTKTAAVPTATLYMQNSQANRSAEVGNQITTRFEGANWKPNSPISYYLEIGGADARTTGPFNYTTDANGNQNNSFTSTLLANPSISGAVTYRIRIEGADQNGVARTAYSNSITITWSSPQPTTLGIFNGATSYTSAFVGDLVSCSIQSTGFKPYSTVTFYLYISGAENRTAGPFVHTADANGDVYNGFQSTLLDNPNITGMVYYTWGTTGSKLDGSYTSFNSNQVAIDWRKR